MNFMTDIQAILNIFMAEAWDLFPYFALSVLFAAFIKTFKWDRRVRASVSSYPRTAIIIATLAGILSPLCSCGILPVVIALSGAGVPIPPVMALLITSPIMSPDSLIITAAEMGTAFAVGKLIVALVTGMGTGFLCSYLVNKGFLPPFPFLREKFIREAEEGKRSYREIIDAGCFEHEGASHEKKPGTVSFFFDRARDMAWITGKFLLIALLIQASINYFVPSNMVEAFLGSRNANSVILATIISVPLPVHQMVAPPVLKGLIAMGLSPGAAMAFLTGGPVTSIPAIGLLSGMYQKRALVTYMGVGTAVTLMAGIVFQVII